MDGHVLSDCLNVELGVICDINSGAFWMLSFTQLLRPLYYKHFIQESTYNAVCILKLEPFGLRCLKCHFKKRKVAFFEFSKKNVKTYFQTDARSQQDSNPRPRGRW